MNLVLLEKKDFTAEKTVVISERRAEHLNRVNKVKKGDTLKCGILNGNMGSGLVTDLSGQAVEMEVHLENDPPPPLPLTLVLALPRPKMLRRIIQQATTLGVKEIYLINSWRVEKSFWQSPHLEEASLRKQMVLGLEQGCDTIMPVVHKKRFFTSFVNEELPLLSKGAFCMTAHPKTENECPANINKKCVLVIGPEGGFIDIEIETLEKNGFLTCHIGRRILKVETAVTYLISRLFM